MLRRLLASIAAVLLVASAAYAVQLGGSGSDTGDLFPGRIYHTSYGDALLALSTAKVPPAGAPDFAAFPAGSVTKAFLFDDSSDECLSGAIQLSHHYDEENNLLCHIHWSPLTTATDNVVWQMDYTYAGLDQVFTASTQIYIQDAGDGVANKNQMASFPPITCTGCTVSSILQVTVCRDGDGTNATDDMVGDAAGHFVDCHEVRDTIGSLSENEK